jgi:hypothetical protein
MLDPFLVAGQTEEPVLLGDELEGSLVFGTPSPVELTGRVEAFAAHAVVTLVGLLVEVPVLERRVPEVVDGRNVAGGAALVRMKSSKLRSSGALRPSNRRAWLSTKSRTGIPATSAASTFLSE